VTVSCYDALEIVSIVIVIIT